MKCRIVDVDVDVEEDAVGSKILHLREKKRVGDRC